MSPHAAFVPGQQASVDQHLEALREPKTFAKTQDRTEQLRRCVHDDDLPTDVRAAGILILLYGLRSVDLLSLRREQLIQRGSTAHYLKIDTAPLLLPPPLVSLLGSYRCTATTTAPFFRKPVARLRCYFHDSAAPNHGISADSGPDYFSTVSTFEEDATPPDSPWPLTYPHQSLPISWESTTSPQPAGPSEQNGTGTPTWHNGAQT